ncbi:MAG: hypothetical protein ACE5OZ_12175 [Candidatus Heimdallarchaeota archaeon]
MRLKRIALTPNGWLKAFPIGLKRAIVAANLLDMEGSTAGLGCASGNDERVIDMRFG